MLSWRALFVYVVCLLAGCFAQAASTPSPAASLAAFISARYDRQIKYSDQPGSKIVAGCQIGGAYITSSDPVTRQPRLITLKEFRPVTTASKNRAVIVVPESGEGDATDLHFAQRFCEAGIRSVVIQQFTVLPDSGVDVKAYDRQTLRGLIAIRHTITMLNATGSHSVGIIATGIGASQAAFATMIDSRLNTAVFVAGGLGLADILTTTTDANEAALRGYRMQASHMNASQYASAIHAAIHIDAMPFVSPSLATTKSVVNVIATKDTAISYESQMRLYEAFGRQGVIPLDSEHHAALATTAVAKTRILADYFLSKLAP